MRTSDSYLFTVDHRTPAGQKKIAQARARLRKLNKERGEGVSPRVIALYPRLGPNSPFATLYSAEGSHYRPSSQRIRPEHGVRTDVYAMPVDRPKGGQPKWVKKKGSYTEHATGKVVTYTYTYQVPVTVPLPK